MAIEKRHFGRIAEPRGNGAIGEADISKLVHRFVLFDECIIESKGMERASATRRSQSSSSSQN